MKIHDFGMYLLNKIYLVTLDTCQNFVKKIKNMLKILTHMSNTDHNKNLIDYKGS